MRIIENKAIKMSKYYRLNDAHVVVDGDVCHVYMEVDPTSEYSSEASESYPLCELPANIKAKFTERIGVVSYSGKKLFINVFTHEGSNGITIRPSEKPAKYAGTFIKFSFLIEDIEG